MAEWLRR
jgi:hypothetical protein